MRVTWTPLNESDVVDYYTVHYSRVNGGSGRRRQVVSGTVTFPASGSSGVVSGLQEGQQYQFSVSVSLTVSGQIFNSVPAWSTYHCSNQARWVCVCFKYVREYTPTTCVRVQQLIVVLKTVNNNGSLVTTACKAKEFTNTHIFYNNKLYYPKYNLINFRFSSVVVQRLLCWAGWVSVILTASLIGNIVLVGTIGCILMRKHPLDQNK